jgi:hypothetical protein
MFDRLDVGRSVLALHFAKHHEVLEPLRDLPLEAIYQIARRRVQLGNIFRIENVSAITGRFRDLRFDEGRQLLDGRFNRRDFRFELP